MQVVLAVAPNPAFALDLGPVPAVLEPKKQVGAVCEGCVGMACHFFA